VIFFYIKEHDITEINVDHLQPHNSYNYSLSEYLFAADHTNWLIAIQYHNINQS